MRSPRQSMIHSCTTIYDALSPQSKRCCLCTGTALSSSIPTMHESKREANSEEHMRSIDESSGAQDKLYIVDVRKLWTIVPSTSAMSTLRNAMVDARYSHVWSHTVCFTTWHLLSIACTFPKCDVNTSIASHGLVSGSPQRSFACLSTRKSFCLEMPVPTPAATVEPPLFSPCQAIALACSQACLLGVDPWSASG